MSKLTEIQKIYPLAKYEPDSKCQICHGTGKKKPFVGKYIDQRPFAPCICLFIEAPLLKECSDIVNEIVRPKEGGEDE